MMTKSRRWGVAASAVALFAAAACTPGGGGDDDNGDGGPVELVFAIGGAEAQEGAIHPEIVDLWNQNNEDIQVRIEQLPEDADGQREQHALELQAEGSNFDMLGMDVIWTGEYAENGWLESLEDQRDDFSGSIESALDSASWGGELWAAPYNTNAGFFYYRTDLVDGPPATWQEMCETGTPIAEQNGMSTFIGQGAQYEGFIVNWLEIYWSAGGDLYNDDQSEVVFDTDLATQVTQWMADNLSTCFAPGYNTAMEEEARNAFQQGETIYVRNWPYIFTLINEDTESPANGNFEISPLPTWEGGEPASASGGFNLGVSAFSENTEEAIEFVTWASSDPEPQALLATGGSVPPTLQSVYDDPELQDDPVMAMLGEVLPDTVARPPAPWWNELSVEMQQNIFPAVNGDADIEQSIAAVHDYLQSTVE